MSSYKYNARLSSSPKVVSSHIHDHATGQRNSVKGIKIKQRTTRSSNIRLQQDIDGYSDSSDSTNCSDLSNNNSINSLLQNRKNSVNSYSGRNISNSGVISKRTSISAKRSSLTERPPIPIKNNNILKKKSIDSSNHESLVSSPVTSSMDKKLLNISINDQANDRALRKIMDLEILNESLRSINESLECTIKEQSLKMEQLQLQIDHLKSASTLNSTADDDFLFDFLLTKDTNSDSEIKIIPRHPQHANKSTVDSNQLSSSIPEQNVANDSMNNDKSLLSNKELNEDSDVQFKRICAKLEFLINDATKAVGLKPKEVEKNLTKEKRFSQDPNDIKIERRHNNKNNNNNNNNELTNDKNIMKISDSNVTLVEEDLISSNSNNSEDNNNSDLTKITEEIVNEKSKTEISSEATITQPKIIQSTDEIHLKYNKVFDIIERLNNVSKDVINETTNFEQSQNLKNKEHNENKEHKDENSKSSSNRGLAMLLNPLLNYQNDDDNNNNKLTSPESSNKIKELTLSMNLIIGNLIEVLNEEKQKELKQSEEQIQNQKATNNNVRCPIVITSGRPNEKFNNKSGFNRRNSSVTSPKFSRTTSVEHGVSIGGDSSESMMKINAILNSNGNTVVNSSGYPSILSNIPFKKDNKLFHRTRTWDPQYLNHYRSLSVQSPSSLRNVKSPTLTSSSSSNITNNTNNNNESSSNHITKTGVNENELKFQSFVQGLERKKTHHPSFYH